MPLGGMESDNSKVKRYLVSTVIVLFLGMLSLELSARFYAYLYRPYQSYQDGFDAKYIISANIRSNLPLIILSGDSMMNKGVSPELLEQRLKDKDVLVRVINLAVTGSTPAITLRLLQTMKNNNITPALVLYDYDVVYTNANSDYIKLVTDGYKNVALLDHSYLGRCVLGAGTILRDKLICRIEKYSFFIRYRKQLKYQTVNFFTLLFNVPKFNAESSVSLSNTYERQTTHLGWMPSHQIWSKEDQDSQQQSRIDFLYRRGPRNPNYQYSWKGFQQVIDFTQQNNITLVLTWLPQYKPEYEKSFYKVPYTYQWFRHQFKSIETQYKNVFALDLNDLADDFVNFEDYRHLNIYGAIKATDKLAEKLSKEPFRSLILHNKSNSIESAAS